MFDVITIGGASRDIFMEVPEMKTEKEHNRLDQPHLKLPFGEKFISDKTYYTYGGGALNVSVCLSRLGLKVASVCNVGREGSGTMVVDYLRKEKVNTTLVNRDKLLHTGVSLFVIGEDGEHAGFLERGANNHLTIESIKPLYKTKWFYISSLTGNSEQILPHVFEVAKKRGIRIAFNPGSQQLMEGYPGLKKYLAQSEILLLNIEEAERLAYSKTGHKPKTEKELLNICSEFGATITVITEGDIGAHALFEGRDFHQSSIPQKQVLDTTGAGDAFGGTFLFAISKGFDIRYSLKIAAINSGSVVTKMGASAGLLSYNKIKSSKWL